MRYVWSRMRKLRVPATERLRDREALLESRSWRPLEKIKAAARMEALRAALDVGWDRPIRGFRVHGSYPKHPDI